MAQNRCLEPMDKIVTTNMPQLKSSITPYRPKPKLIRSLSPKLENDKRNGLDLQLPEEQEAVTVKRVRWAPMFGDRNEATKPSTYISPLSSKQIRPDQDTPDEVRLVNELRLAVHRGGGSIDPEKNYELRACLSPLQLPYSRVQRILRECELNERNQSTYSLPMDYARQLVAMVCKVRTDNLIDLKLRLAPLLRHSKSRFFNRHLFNETGLIKAIVPSKSPLSFDDFNQTLRTDALWCKATDSAITDLGKGAVLFKCRPQDLREVTDKLRQCSYKITHTEVGHCPNKSLVDLTDRQMSRYQEFCKILLEDKDIVKIYDNVRAH
ncbi:probable transcriptional regulatory protein Dtur_1615 isoform X1 [Drosophila takahashii]|uniref:probable transcriptional regulatory protein Dtur_1615 isoform X1 n=1 Tax=Drosophila takahashii TaxID=29030 RepID=UPI001CF92CBE|nr:uncharacterized protein LOC108055662 [Drosophila takahashii]